MSYETAVAELAELGIVPTINENINNSEANREIEIITTMEKITGIKFSEEQKKILLYHGNACIIACAGSGKTSSITNLIAKRIMTHEIKDTNKLICTTYSKGGATEMEERLHKLLNQFGMDRPIKVVTMHAWFYSLIRTFGLDMDVISESERLKLIRESSKEAQFELRDDDLMTLSNLISYQVNNLMSDKKALESEANTLDNLTLEKYAIIRSGYAKKKAKMLKLDFDDMQMYLYKWLVKDKNSENEAERQSSINVRNYCKYMWDDFFIDEAQDISKIQFAIIKEIVADPENKNKLDKNLIFVGDDDQCIYQWRGADPSIILNIGNLFDMNILMLSTNYRCAKNIVEFASKSIEHNTSRYTKSMKAFNTGGNVKIAVSDKSDLNALSTIALNHIKELIKQGEKPNDICVMSRNNFHLAILSNRLLKEGIYTISTNEMKLTTSSMYKDIKTIMNLGEDCWDVNVTKSLLWKLCRYMSIANSNSIGAFQDSIGLTLKDTLTYMFEHFDKNKSVKLDRNIKVPVQAEQAMVYKWNKLSRETIDNLYMLWSLLNDSDINKRILGIFTMYMECAGALLYKTKDKERSLKGICNYMYLLLKDSGYSNTMEFLRITEQYEQGSMYIPGEKITLTTVHSAKGKEWKNVIAFAVDNVSMPSKDSISAMIKEGQTINDINEYINEERRLYYVEMTRAKNNLLIITYNEPSIFIMESLEAIKDNRKDTNYMLIEALSQDSYAADNAYKNIFNNDILNNKVLDKQGEYYYSSITS